MTENERLAFLKRHTPCYVYDERAIRERAGTLKTMLPGYDFLYSIKTNPFPPVVAAIAGCGLGADAASAGEVRISRAAGVSADDIYYSAPGKSRADIEDALNHCVLTADSVGELERINAAAMERGESVRVGLRVNPDFTMDGDRGAAGKFGVCAEDLPELSDRLSHLHHLSVVGIHVHVKSQILDAALLGRYYGRCLQLAQKIDTLPGFSIRFVNFGGGVGTVYDRTREKPLDFARLAEQAACVADENQRTLGARLLIESGRFLTCNAGAYYTSVVDVKRARGKTYVIVQGGLNGFSRPVFAHMLESLLPDGGFPAPEPLYTCKNAFSFELLTDAPQRETVDLVGNLCTAADVLAAGITLPKAEVGDLVRVSNAGSYAHALTPVQFSSHAAPVQYLLREDGSLGE